MKKERNTAIYIAYEDHEPPDPAVAERSLLRAVLLSAMNDLKKEGEASRKAQEYLLDQEEDYLFSFRSICSFLNVDPERVLVVTGLKDSSVLPAQRDSLDKLISDLTPDE